MNATLRCCLQLALCFCLLRTAAAYQVLISDTDDARQVCSGMWGSGGSQDPSIEVLFSPSSRGQLALIIYEWKDAKYIGIDADGSGASENQWEDERVYVCNLAAYQANLCTMEQLGAFIVNTPQDVERNSTSIYTTAVRFDARAALGDGAEATPAGVNSGPFRYPVSRTGYYCVGAVPVTVSGGADEGFDNASTSYTGVVDFINTFQGHLPAAEYPKIYFYAALAFMYTLMGGGWAFLCWKFRGEILSIQHYVSATIIFIVVEMIALSGYYRYLNNSGTASLAKVYLGLVAILNAARNSISLFMLLIVCLGYGIVRPDLGSVMLRARLLAIVHFVFGVIYSIGIVTVPLESAGIFIFFCVFPLAFSLTTFMMWTMWSLNATIQDLENRKQSFKKQMFTKLYRILMAAVMVIAAFFVISSVSFSNRLDEDYTPETWQSRWWLLDGWLGLLYFCCFAAIAFIWRPNSNNRRLAMSDELATDEADADEFEVDTLRRERLEDEERAEGKDGVPSGYGGVRGDDVVFDIGEEADSDDEDHNSKSRSGKARRSMSNESHEESHNLRTSEDSSKKSQPPRYSSLG